MKISYVQRNYKVADKFKEVLEKKLEKLERYFVNEIEVKVNCEEQNKVQKLEVTVNADRFTFRSEVKSDNMYNNIDQVLPKLEKQIIKNSSKYKSKYKKGGIKREDLQFIEETPEEDSLKVVKKKSFEVYPVSLKDAQDNMEALDHSFYIFINEETGKLNVMYERDDGNLGVIEVVY